MSEEANFTDPRDGKVYKTVKIGDQIWMAENLAYATEGSKIYDNDESNCKKYGRLYDWTTAIKVCCPPDWHLPSREEWRILVDFVGGKKIAGKKLKAKSGWNNYEGESGNGSDDFGFSALPGGYCNSDGFFYDAGIYGCYWSTSEYGSYYVFGNPMYYYKEVIYGFNSKSELLSIRCVKD